jgi:hypothetical protein
MQKLVIIFLLAGLLQGCASGQTQADDASQRPKNRCDPGLRCGGPVDDPPSSTVPPRPPATSNNKVILHE